jgi:glyoxylase-like metal-dependent hydrolase (beta-lactamase superfamily II)
MPLSRRSFMAAATAASVAPAALSVPRFAEAAAPPVGKQAPAFYRTKLGDFEVTVVQDGVVKVTKPESLVVNRPFEEVGKALDAAFIPRDNVWAPFTPVIINTGKNLVLIDTGFGDNGPPTTGNLKSNLAASGIDPKSIDTVLITHFHPDHIQGVRQKSGEANFPNAQIIVPSGEWKHWNDEGELGKAADVWKPSFAATKRVFGPVAKDVTQVEYGKEVVPGITAVDSRGHSPGHASYVVSSGNSKLLVIGDLTNNPVLFARNPEWQLWANMIPAEAVASRRKVLDMAAAEKMPIVGYHYPFPAFGYIAKLGNGYDFVPVTWQPVL